MREYLACISWETKVWVAETPSHLIHLNLAQSISLSNNYRNGVNATVCRTWPFTASSTLTCAPQSSRASLAR